MSSDLIKLLFLFSTLSVLWDVAFGEIFTNPLLVREAMLSDAKVVERMEKISHKFPDMQPIFEP